MGKFFELQFLTGHIHYLLFIVLMMTGLFIVVDKTNLVKKIIGLNIFQVSVFMFMYRLGKLPMVQRQFFLWIQIIMSIKLQCKQFYIQIHYRMF